MEKPSLEFVYVFQFAVSDDVSFDWTAVGEIDTGLVLTGYARGWDFLVPNKYPPIPITIPIPTIPRPMLKVLTNCCYLFVEMEFLVEQVFVAEFVELDYPYIKYLKEKYKNQALTLCS